MQKTGSCPRLPALAAILWQTAPGFEAATRAPAR
jgi:hypothetical protein